MKRIIRILATLRRLKASQIVFQIYYRLNRRRRFRRPVRARAAAPAPPAPKMAPSLPPPRRLWEDGAFTFLNRSRRLPFPIDWDPREEEKLWVYNLNYFEFLQQNDLPVETGIRLIRDFLRRMEDNPTGLEPYPTSLRLVNWIKFLARHQIRDPEIAGAIAAQTGRLRHNLEYNLSGNHLLENAFALLFAAVFLKEPAASRKARRLLRRELPRQILPDGAHYERSPMYHQILLLRILDAVNLLRGNPSEEAGLLPLLEDRARLMRRWLKGMTFSSGAMPLFGDSALGIAPGTAGLEDYAGKLGLGEIRPPENPHFSPAGGYGRFNGESYEMIFSAGGIGPDHLPAHAHCDIFSFELHIASRPVIVDPGVFTYREGPERLAFKSTRSHNTVQVEDGEQMDMWSSFRVGRRGRVRRVAWRPPNFLQGEHTGFAPLGAIHNRAFTFRDRGLLIQDRVDARKSRVCRARLHFHPDQAPRGGEAGVETDELSIEFQGLRGMRLLPYDYSEEFNRSRTAACVEVDFISGRPLLTTFRIRT
jgi:hypothetical protein